MILLHQMKCGELGKNIDIKTRYDRRKKIEFKDHTSCSLIVPYFTWVPSFINVPMLTYLRIIWNKIILWRAFLS